MLPFLMCCHRGKSESVYHLSCPPGYVSIELEHDLDDDVFEQSYFGYEYEMFKSFPKASKPAKKKSSQVLSSLPAFHGFSLVVGKLVKNNVELPKPLGIKALRSPSW